MKRFAILILALLISATTAAAGDLTLLKRTIFITPQRFLRYWKNPKAAEPIYDTYSWYPNIKFDVLGPLVSGSKLFVEIDHPNGTPWLIVNMESPSLDEDVLETIKPESMDSSTEEKLATIETGAFPFRIKMKSANNPAGMTIFTGKFNVVLLSLDQNITEYRGKKEFMVDYDWHLPLGYLWLNPVMDADVPNLSSQVCLKGKIDAGVIQSYVFYNGKQISEGASNAPTQTLTSGADEPHHRYTILQSNFANLRGFNHSQSMNNYSQNFFMDKNPGDYEVRIMRSGQLVRSIKFSVGKDGAIVDNGFAKNAKLGGVRMIFPAIISGTLDGGFNASAWKTDALFGNPPAGFSIP